jgi:hypothetical protein
MSLAAPAAIRRSEAALTSLTRVAVPLLLFAAIGVEIVALLSWTPDTLGSWLNPGTNGYGDFPIFYSNARTFSFNALYSPGLTVLMHPLTYMDQRPAFGVYTGVNILALTAVAFIAQRAVASWPAKAAIVLGMFALPQTHWSMRIGHFTQVLAIAALAGLLLADRKPVLAGLCIAMLALKPQYLPVPLLYLLFTKNWRALAAVFGAFVVLGVAGVAASAMREPSGLRMFLYAGEYYHERIPEAWSFLTVGQRDQLYPQGWQYSWYGFLLSAGQQPNPLVAADLMLLTLAATVVAWWKCTPSVAKVATALAMLMLAPHSSFYNWSMLSVAAALLLHSDLRSTATGRALVPAILAGMAIAAAASQQATPFPLPYDAYRPASTLGIYWVQPAALATIIVLAVFGRRRAAATVLAPSTDLAQRAAVLLQGMRRAPHSAGASSAIVEGDAALLETGADPRTQSPAASSPAASSSPPSDVPTLAFDSLHPWKGARFAASTRRTAHMPRRAAPATRLTFGALAAGAMLAGALSAAFVTGAGPFRSEGDFGRSRILAALPADFPAPASARIDDTGAGARYPYRVEWRTDAPASEVAAAMRQRLGAGAWSIVNSSAVAPATRAPGDAAASGAATFGHTTPAAETFRSARSATGGAPVIADITIEPAGHGSRVRVEFSPLPASSIPGYQHWLQHIGLVVHDLPPGVSSE